jgi:hypothetical protein
MTNHLCSRLEIIPHAAGENDGTMYAMPNWHHLEAQEDSSGAIAIGTKSVDTMCGDYACVPDLIKIDVEGFELNVLKGATRVLAKRPVVNLEVHPQLTRKLKYDHTKCFDLLSEMGYEISDVDGSVMTRRAFWQRHHTFFTVCRGG